MTQAELKAQLDKAQLTYDKMKAGLPNLGGDQASIAQYQNAYNQSQVARDNAQKAYDSYAAAPAPVVQPFTAPVPTPLPKPVLTPGAPVPVAKPVIPTTVKPTPVATPGLLTAATVKTPAQLQAEKLTAAAQWNVTPDQTVAGQLNKITASGSPTMQLASEQGKSLAAERGLLNSSLAAQASQNAVIQNALPIAQADAETNVGATRYNVDTANTFKTKNTDAENQARSTTYAATNKANEFNASAVNQARETYFAAQEKAKEFNATAKNRADEFNALNEYNKQQALFEGNVKASLAQIDNEAQFDRAMQTTFGGLSDTFAKNLMQINTNTDMNQQSKDYAVQQMYNLYKSQVSLLSAVGSIPDVSQLLVA